MKPKRDIIERVKDVLYSKFSDITEEDFNRYFRVLGGPGKINNLIDDLDKHLALRRKLELVRVKQDEKSQES